MFNYTRVHASLQDFIAHNFSMTNMFRFPIIYKHDWILQDKAKHRAFVVSGFLNFFKKGINIYLR